VKHASLSSLPLSEIHLWFAVADEAADPELLTQYRSLLSPGEMEQEIRFRFPVDQHRYLLTRALIRTVLSRYAPIDPAHWRFEPDRYGKPVILNDEPAAQLLRFNVSHTSGLVMLGVTRECAVGVDTENTRDRRTPYVKLADRFFSKAEAHSLRSLPKPLQRERFFEYWTLKESYIKACGKGLSIPLDQFGFVMLDSALSFKVAPDLNDDARNWQFWLLRPSAKHIAAVCVRRPAIAKQNLITRKTTPLGAEERFNCELIAHAP
jgi:4'-phosphopantetheinyl transferase